MGTLSRNVACGKAAPGWRRLDESGRCGRKDGAAQGAGVQPSLHTRKKKAVHFGRHQGQIMRYEFTALGGSLSLCMAVRRAFLQREGFRVEALRPSAAHEVGHPLRAHAVLEEAAGCEQLHSSADFAVFSLHSGMPTSGFDFSFGSFSRFSCT